MQCWRRISVSHRTQNILKYPDCVSLIVFGNRKKVEHRERFKVRYNYKYHQLHLHCAHYYFFHVINPSDETYCFPLSCCSLDTLKICHETDLNPFSVSFLSCGQCNCIDYVCVMTHNVLVILQYCVNF